jgi:putative nucleotidyltransferase with HDIG domain
MDEVPTPRAVRAALSKKESLPTLPTTYTKLIRVIGNPNTSISELVEIITYEPILTANLLRVANSAYTCLSDPVEDVSDAVMYMGMNEVGRIALSVGYFDVFAAKGVSADFLKGIWLHSISVALLSWRMATIGQFTFAQEAYLAGLLHDIGKLFFATTYTSAYASMRTRVVKGEVSGLEIENSNFGIMHTEAGEELCRFWKLSGRTIEIVRKHHEPETASEESRELALCVAAANIMAHQLIQDEPVDSRLEQADAWVRELSTKAKHPEFFAPDQLVPILSQEIEKAQQMVASTAGKK